MVYTVNQIENGNEERGCGSESPFAPGLGYHSARGYRYDVPRISESKSNKASLGGFLKETALGGLMGGLAGAAFYKVGKGLDKLKESVLPKKSRLGLQAIKNRYLEEPQAGWEIDYAIENGKIHVDNGMQNVDFIIDMDGNLHIGRGHSYLANGADVQAAGTLKINSQGYVRAITNASGHYAPTVAQGRTFPNILNNLGIRTQNAWLELGDYRFTPSGYVDVMHSSIIAKQLK